MPTILLILSLIATPVEIDVHYLPDGERVTLKSGETAQAYDLGAFKKLLQIDADLWGATRQLELYKESLTAQTMALNESTRITDLLWEDIEIIRARSLRLEDNWLKCEERKTDDYSYWPYIVGGAGVLVGAMGLGYGVGTSLQQW